MRTLNSLRQILLHVCATAVVAVTLGGIHPAYAAKPYTYYFVGNQTDVVLPHPATPSTVLMGGGPDVDDAFKWMIKKSGGGNFVVIRADGDGAYNPYIYAMGGVASVETIVIPSREAANDPFVVARIKGAEALFIAGGDQSDYIKYWQDTPVQAAIQELANKNIPIGGTSAGLAVMGQYAFTALNGSIGSADALANPFDKSITLGRNFLALPYMGGLITDAHLDSRDRMGRLVTFMARIVNDGWASTVNGVGVDVQDGAARRQWHGDAGRNRIGLFPANRGISRGMQTENAADLP